MPIVLAGRRYATTALAQTHARDLSLSADPHRRKVDTYARNSLFMRSNVGGKPTHGSRLPSRTPTLQRSNPHSARGTTACHFPRFRSLKAFGRRPRCPPQCRDRPASETLNKRYSFAMSALRPLKALALIAGTLAADASQCPLGLPATAAGAF